MSQEIHRRFRISSTEANALFGVLRIVDAKDLIDLKERLADLIAENEDPYTQAIFQKYREAAEVKDGVREIDDDAEVSIGDDDGAYVMTWVWVPGTPCRTCGDLCEDGGDGFDGMCPSCADKAEEDS